MSEVVGHVVEITRFPVKSMAGERRVSTEIDWHGLEGDRQYGFVKSGNVTRFPWLTARDLPELVRYAASYDQPERPRGSAVTVRAPGGRSFGLIDPALKAELRSAAGTELDLLQLGTGAFDSMPVSIVTTGSFARLEQLHGASVDRRRFRVNIVVDSDAAESDWQGRRVRLGSGADAPELYLAYPAPRCSMIAIDPDDAARDSTVLRTVARELGNAFTMYASVSRRGLVRRGDVVHLLGS